MSDFFIDFKIPVHQPSIRHTDKIMLIGSCFTEHISKRMETAGMAVNSNPNGILFNPQSVCRNLQRYLQNETVAEEELFYLNEVWNHWDFHSRFSQITLREALYLMNTSVSEAARFIKDADWLIITLGSAFQYFDIRGDANAVANCHRAPAHWFEKRLLKITEIADELEKTLNAARYINSKLNVVFTISPVRHLRDGVIDNNRSKARLTEVVHYLKERLQYCSYFPAYELVIDVLRDYRFYDIDMAHPNYAATNYVWDQFTKTFFDGETRSLMKQLEELNLAVNHRPRFPETKAHQQFLRSSLDKALLLQERHPHLDLQQMISFFEKGTQ